MPTRPIRSFSPGTVWVVPRKVCCPLPITLDFYGVRSGFPNAIYITAQGLDTGMNDSGTDYGWANTTKTNDQDVDFTKP